MSEMNLYKAAKMVTNELQTLTLRTVETNHYPLPTVFPEYKSMKLLFVYGNRLLTFNLIKLR